MNDYENIKDYGFIEPKIDETQWQLGALGDAKPINKSGDWKSYAPIAEQQTFTYETANCTAFGTTNAIEALFRFHWNQVVNWSDRDLGIKAGTRPPGNDPHHVSEIIRKEGLVPEDVLPYDGDNVEEYYTYPSKQVEVECVRKGLEWTRWYDFNHVWAWTAGAALGVKDKHAILKDSLRHGPICVSVRAWKKENGVYVKTKGQPDTHWCFLTHFDPEGHPVILDSYPDDGVFYKTLSDDYDFNFAKVFYLKRREKPLVQGFWLVEPLKRLVELLKAIINV